MNKSSQPESGRRLDLCGEIQGDEAAFYWKPSPFAPGDWREFERQLQRLDPLVQLGDPLTSEGMERQQPEAAAASSLCLRMLFERAAMRLLAELNGVAMSVTQQTIPVLSSPVNVVVGYDLLAANSRLPFDICLELSHEGTFRLRLKAIVASNTGVRLPLGDVAILILPDLQLFNAKRCPAGQPEALFDSLPAGAFRLTWTGGAAEPGDVDLVLELK